MRFIRFSLLRLWILLFIGTAMGCGKTSQESIPVKKQTMSDGPEFREIANRVKQIPSFAMSDEPKEIKLQSYSKFDGEEITSRVMSLTEWNDLKNALQSGTEVENTRPLALSAGLQIFSDKSSEPIFGLDLYWTSDSGDVYFETNEQWFKVSDRATVLRAIREKKKN